MKLNEFNEIEKWPDPLSHFVVFNMNRIHGYFKIPFFISISNVVQSWGLSRSSRHQDYFRRNDLMQTMMCVFYLVIIFLIGKYDHHIIWNFNKECVLFPIVITRIPFAFLIDRIVGSLWRIRNSRYRYQWRCC